MRKASEITVCAAPPNLCPEEKHHRSPLHHGKVYTPEQIVKVLGRTSGHSRGGMENRRGCSLRYTLSIWSTRLPTPASHSQAQGPQHYTTFFLNRRREGLLVTSPWIVTKTEKAKEKKNCKETSITWKAETHSHLGSKIRSIYLSACLFAKGSYSTYFVLSYC